MSERSTTDERIATALENIANELEYQNAVLSEQARAQHLTAVSANKYTEPDERAESAPNTRSLLTKIRDNESERERVDALFTDGGGAAVGCTDAVTNEDLEEEEDQSLLTHALLWMQFVVSGMLLTQVTESLAIGIGGLAVAIVGLWRGIDIARSINGGDQ